MKKLSQILIESQTKRKQNFECLVGRDDGKIESYCAIGAIGCELGIITNEDYAHTTGSVIIKSFEQLEISRGKDIPCPICDSKRDLGLLIVHMNDGHQQTFEQIGKYLEGLNL